MIESRCLKCLFQCDPTFSEHIKLKHRTDACCQFDAVATHEKKRRSMRHRSHAAYVMRKLRLGKPEKYYANKTISQMTSKQVVPVVRDKPKQRDLVRYFLKNRHDIDGAIVICPNFYLASIGVLSLIHI